MTVVEILSSECSVNQPAAMELWHETLQHGGWKLGTIDFSILLVKHASSSSLLIRVAAQMIDSIITEIYYIWEYL